MFEMIHVISWKNGITKISEKEYYEKWNIKYPIFKSMSLHPGDTLTRLIALIWIHFYYFRESLYLVQCQMAWPVLVCKCMGTDGTEVSFVSLFWRISDLSPIQCFLFSTVPTVSLKERVRFVPINFSQGFLPLSYEKSPSVYKFPSKHVLTFSAKALNKTQIILFPNSYKRQQD